MALLKALLTEARPGAHQAPDFTLTDALARAAQRLCRTSGIWRETLDPIVLIEDQAEYELEPPGESVVERLVVVKVGGCPVKLPRYRELFALRATTGTPTHAAMMPDSSRLAVWPAPSVSTAGLTIVAHVVLAVRRDAREIPDFLADEWHDAIVAGAKAELFATPAMPWTDLKAAQVHARFFDEEIARATREQHSEHASELRVQQRPFI